MLKVNGHEECFFFQILVSCLILREILSILGNFFSGVLLYHYPPSPLEWPCLIIKLMNLCCQNRHKNSAHGCSNFVISTRTTSGPSSSCEMIILRNNSHGGIIRVSMGIFTTALRNKKIYQILKKKHLTLLPQRIACYLAAYFDEKNAF